MKRFLLPILAFAVLSVKPMRAAYAPTPDQLAVLNALERAECQYFIDQAVPGPNGYYLMPNQWGPAGADPRCTDEGTGLELVALCIADSHGWTPKGWALTRAQAVLAGMVAIQKANMALYNTGGANKIGGFFFHYMNSDGTPTANPAPPAQPTNMGSDDNARFINGALVARQYFNDLTVTAAVNTIYGNMNWSYWASSTKNSEAYEAWTPTTLGQADGGSFNSSQWGRYSEGPLQVYLVGMGSPTSGNALGIANWESWTRASKADPLNTYTVAANATYGITTSETASWMGVSPCLFVHQYPEAFFYLNGLLDNSTGAVNAYDNTVYPSGISYWQNSISATLAQWQWSQDISGDAIAYSGLPSEGPCSDWSASMWGLTASNCQLTVNGEPTNGYASWGGPIASDLTQSNGTVSSLIDGTLTPAATAGSIPFTPQQSIVALEYMYNNYGPSNTAGLPVWLRDPVSGDAYGFPDAFTASGTVGAGTTSWIDQELLTNGTGQSMIMIENYLTGMVWMDFMSCPEINSALITAFGQQRTAAPTFSVTSGTYGSALSVTMSSSTSIASIRYTTDGSTPTETHGTLYQSTPVNVGASETLNAIAYESVTGGNPVFTDSAVTAATYTIGADSPVKVTSGGGWTTNAVSPALSSGSITVNFDAVFNDVPPATATTTDGIIGLSNVAATSINQYSVAVRFAASGFFSVAANSKGNFVVSTIPYSVNTSYHFRLVINDQTSGTGSYTYSAYVTPAGGSEQMIGTGAYNFAVDAAPLASWGAMVEPAATGTSVTISNFLSNN